MKTDIRDKAQAWMEDSEQVARNIWLAGLGVYSKSLEEAQQLEGRSNDLFESLVEQGREVEAQTRETIEQQVGSANRNVEKRVQDLFSRLSGVKPERLDELNDKVDKLTKAVEALNKG
ncbi:phasin family protein [Ferrimonas marina]|uniref:Poly(Hydroxyalkanoate) granule-associated protein n=1 Tax=Ferrimonas marina TaxID=299255 RepID=A0A1M5ZTL2_9GAMM|nr:phasin family protein [Ferrimonas marina]SHI27508.1 poly(hydroxyalkanoate) granule-associated protein [Ferrimonas marina]